MGAKRLPERERELMLEIKSDTEFIEAMAADNQDPETSEDMQFHVNRREELRAKKKGAPGEEFLGGGHRPNGRDGWWCLALE